MTSTRIVRDLKIVLSWFTMIGAAILNTYQHFLRPKSAASDNNPAESDQDEAQSLATANENATMIATANPSAVAAKVTSDVALELDHEELRRPNLQEETRAVATASENATTIATAKSSAAAINVGSYVGPGLDQEEIQRRRDLVRVLFNDFWRGSEEKPAAFVERLNQAEDYLNERLATSGELWRLDSTMRVMLGLPPRLNSRNKGQNDAIGG
jgi:hypothetical protein